MAIAFNDNIDYSGKKPDFNRQEYATYEDMKAVRKGFMPEIYLGYCLADRKFYKYDKSVDNDPVLGYWREFTGGTTIQVETMPEADETQVGKIYQFIGTTDEHYTNGYFYICNASGETQVVDVTTLDELKEAINDSEDLIEVNTGSETVNTKVLAHNNKNYYVIEDVIYLTENATGDISIDTVIDTNEAVVEQGITREIVVYTYSWANKAVQPTTEMGDVLPYGFQFPATPEDGNAFLYIGPDTFTYNAVTGLTPVSSPQALGLYEEDGSGGYERSNDYQAVVTSYCWYNGSEELFTLSETPSVGDAVWKYDGSEYHNAGTVTEYDSNDGIKASEASWPESFYARNSTDDVTGKTYYESVPQYLSGQIYKYDQSTTSWINMSKINVVKGQINEKIFSELFENSIWNVTSLDHSPTSADSGRPYKLYQYASGRVISYFTPVREGALAEESNMWVYLGSMNDEPGGPYYDVGEGFNLELYINILISNNITKSELPLAEENLVGDVVLYVGEDDPSNNFYTGHVYKCVSEPAEWDPSVNTCYWKEIEGDITVDDFVIDKLCDKYGDKEVDTTQGGDPYELGWEMRNGHKCYVYYSYNEANQDYEWMDFRLDSMHPPAVFVYYEKRLSVIVSMMLVNDIKSSLPVKFITNPDDVPIPDNDNEFALYVGPVSGSWRPGQVYTSWRGGWNRFSDTSIVNERAYNVLYASSHHQLGFLLCESGATVIVGEGNRGYTRGLYALDSEIDSTISASYKYKFTSTSSSTINIRTDTDTLADNITCYFEFNHIWYYDTLIYDSTNDNYYLESYDDVTLPTDASYVEDTSDMSFPIFKLCGGSGGGDAADITYSNIDKPELTNVKLALDDLIAKVYYVAPEITAFTMTPSTTEYEIGTSVSDLVFAWTYNKDVVSQTLTDCTLADETVRTATAAGPYTANKTFTLSADDGENTVTATKSISFKHRAYWGSAAIPTAPATYDSAFILALSDKRFATNTKGTYPMTVANGEYGFLAYPDSWGMVTGWWINGLQAETYDCGTVSFTNASGNTTTFRVLRTTQPSLGYITPEVK